MGNGRNVLTGACLCIINQLSEAERASYNGSIEASQASDVGSIPIARSKNPVMQLALLASLPKLSIWCRFAG